MKRYVVARRGFSTFAWHCQCREQADRCACNKQRALVLPRNGSNLCHTKMVCIPWASCRIPCPTWLQSVAPTQATRVQVGFSIFDTAIRNSQLLHGASRQALHPFTCMTMQSNRLDDSPLEKMESEWIACNFGAGTVSQGHGPRSPSVLQMNLHMFRDDVSYHILWATF
jgi:hypothetical protein